MIEAKEKSFIVPHVQRVSLVGTGGTGSYLAQGLAKMIAGYRLNAEVALIDPDNIEEKNRFRQNFMPWEIGQNKAQALACRLNQQFGLSFAAYPCSAEEYLKAGRGSGLFITCVDKIAPRKLFRDTSLWLDSGNDLDYGQVIFGTSAERKACQEQIKQWGSTPHVNELPNAYLKAGMAKLRDKKSRTASCADTPFAEQGCFINELAAQAALLILHQILVVGTVTTPAVYFDSSKSRMIPARITCNYLDI
ncbi:MAG: ThiF family adenylyltransferase [Desulfomonilia bacterium]